MNLSEMRIEIADNLGILADDGVTITSQQVTSDTIDRRINYEYREKLFPIFGDKFPDDFMQSTISLALYTSTGTADASSTASTLVATTNMFDNSMVGLTIKNSTDSDVREIATYVSPTTVTVTNAIDDDWDGDTLYVFGNEYPLQGDAADARDISRVDIKYSGSDTYYVPAGRENYNEINFYGNDAYSKSDPKWYLTSIDQAGNQIRAVGIRPFPEDETGSLKIRYIERPKKLGADSDQPILSPIGFCDTIVEGVTTWGFRKLKDTNSAIQYQQLYEQSKSTMVTTYKPRSRHGKKKMRPSRIYTTMQRRSI